MRPPNSQFGNDITNTTSSNSSNDNNNNNGDDNGRDRNGNPLPSPQQLGRDLIFTRLAGRGVIRVVGRCDDAKENNNLDLSECQLMQVPDAVYHLMRHTELKTCNLSGNQIKKIPPKFAVNFSLITDLNLSYNQITKLPDELGDLMSLQRLDISHNSFVTLPSVVFKLTKLRQLKANNNQIIDLESDQMICADALEYVDLRHNPLTPQCHDRLKNARVSFKLEISDREIEDWEDLTI